MSDFTRDPLGLENDPTIRALSSLLRAIDRNVASEQASVDARIERNNLTTLRLPIVEDIPS